MNEKRKIGIPVNEEHKQSYLDYYSEWIDIKYELFGTVKRLPSRIRDFTTEDISLKFFPEKFSKGKQIIQYHQREALNIRTSWRLLCNWETNPYRYLEAALAWHKLLKRYIEKDGLRTTGDEWQDKHLIFRLDQDQHNVIHEMELALNPAIVGIVSMADKVAHVIVRIFNYLFPEHNRYILFVKPDNRNKILARKEPSDVKAGEVIKVLEQNNQHDLFTGLFKHLCFFVSEDFNLLRKYRNDYVHGFGQRVGYSDQGIQFIYDYVDVANKDKKKIDPEDILDTQYHLAAISGQEWTHDKLMGLSLKVWNEMIDKIEDIFDELTDSYNKDNSIKE